MFYLLDHGLSKTAHRSNELYIACSLDGDPQPNLLADGIVIVPLKVGASHNSRTPKAMSFPSRERTPTKTQTFVWQGPEVPTKTLLDQSTPTEAVWGKNDSTNIQ